MKSRTTPSPECSLARPLAPEDVRCGQYVSVLNEVVEFPSFLWSGCCVEVQPEELVRVRVKSNEGGIPLRVEAVCLPFVSLRTPHQQTQVLDLRRVQLVRLSRSYGKHVWKALRKQTRPGYTFPDQF